MKRLLLVSMMVLTGILVYGEDVDDRAQKAQEMQDKMKVSLQAAYIRLKTMGLIIDAM